MNIKDISRLVVGLAAGALIVTTLAGTVAAQQSLTGLRGTAPLAENGEAPRLPATEETDIRRVRSYPEQPPTIPHRIDSYQLNKDANKCLACHARSRVSESGAPMISVTHFMDRDGQFLATISPRRYFCNQCHVAQADVPEYLGNTFVDIDNLLAVENAQ